MSLPTIADHALLARAARDAAEAYAAAGDPDTALIYARHAATQFHSARQAAGLPAASTTAQEGNQ